MGAGGFISGMVTSVKNNKRSRNSALKKLKNHKFEEQGKLHFDKKASQKQLTEIRNKIQSENKKKERLYLTLFIVFIVALIVLLGFVKF